MKECQLLLQDDELVTIIVPVYNVIQYLPRCLDSILAQTYRNIEVILIDDGSIDGSGELCDEAVRNDSERLRVIHKRNGGLSEARNTGLDAASGSWVFFLDSDDYISPYCIEVLLDSALCSDADIVECGIKTVGETEPVEWTNPRGKLKLYRQPRALHRFLDYSGTRIVAWNKLYSKQLFDGIRFPIGRLHEDEFTIPLLVERARCYVNCCDPLYAYVQREGSITHQPFSDRRLDGLVALVQRLDHFRTLGNGRVDAINAYHLLAGCRFMENEYGDELNNRQRIFISEAIERSLAIHVSPSYGLTLFAKMALMKHLPEFALKLKGGSR